MDREGARLSWPRLGVWSEEEDWGRTLCPLSPTKDPGRS